MLRDEVDRPPSDEEVMGSKPSNAMQSNRPESGGADKDEQREKSGLLDRDKEKFARSEAEKRDTDAEERSDRVQDEESEGSR